MSENYPLATVDEIIEEARNGRMIVLVDDENRENEGDLVIPAQLATPDAINFMAKFGRGLICLTLTGERVGQRHFFRMLFQSIEKPIKPAFELGERHTANGIRSTIREHHVEGALGILTKVSGNGHVCWGDTIQNHRTHPLTVTAHVL